MIEVSWQTIVAVASILASAFALYSYFSKAVRWLDNQKKQDEEIVNIKEEQTLLVYGVLACLKGLSEQGCDGPVHDAIDKIEKYLNKKAHQ